MRNRGLASNWNYTHSAEASLHLCPQNGFSVPHTVYYIAGRVAAPCWLPGADLTGRRE